MNKKVLVICFFAGLTVSMNACDEGAYNDLQCDETYQTECLSAEKYMMCEGNKLVVKSCDANTLCHMNESGVGECVPFGEPLPATECTNGAEKCENGSAYVCSNGLWGVGTSCANGCDADARKCAAAADNKGTEGNACREIAEGAVGLPCDAGLVCNNNVCTKPVEGTEGAACRVIAEGADGDACDVGLVCSNNVCTKPVEGTEGAACRVIAEGADGDACDAGLVCSNNVCTKPVEGTEGAACRVIAEDADGDACDAGLVCSNNVCTKPVEGTEGAACRVIADGAEGLPCDAGLECNSDKICQASLETLITKYCGIGASLDSSMDLQECSDGLNEMVDRCGEEKGYALVSCNVSVMEGSDCTTEDCYMSEVMHSCKAEYNACDIPVVEVGDACEDSGDCVSVLSDGLVCLDNQCALPEDCKEDNSCQLNDDCVDDDDCAGDLVCNADKFCAAAPDNKGTEGAACREIADPPIDGETKCNAGLECNTQNICQLTLDALITKYCEIGVSVDATIDLQECKDDITTGMIPSCGGDENGYALLSCSLPVMEGADCTTAVCYQNEAMLVCKDEYKACGVPLAEAGDACEVDSDCMNMVSSTQLVCGDNKTCAEAPKDCKDTDTCQIDETCVDNDDCEGYLVCDSSELKCRKAQIGESCEDSDDCVSGLGCDTRVHQCAEVG